MKNRLFTLIFALLVGCGDDLPETYGDAPPEPPSDGAPPDARFPVCADVGCPREAWCPYEGQVCTCITEDGPVACTRNP